MVQINQAACIGCGHCARDCISMAITVMNGAAEYHGPCIQCGHCVAICPTDAVTMPEYDMADVREVTEDCSVEIDGLMDMIRSRRSVRQYEVRSVEREKLERVIQAGRYTATASNRQGSQFILVQDQLDTLKTMVWTQVERIAAQDGPEGEMMKKRLDLRQEWGLDYFFWGAPVVLYICTENLRDAGLAAQNMELAAVAQGLGVLYNGFLQRATQESDEARKWLEVNEEKPIAMCLLLGYPRIKYRRTAPRKKADITWL